jgi:GTP diphosphokinase / guanosine-3',5'-bis(diphosphate) 3'-diphosphatase
MMLVLQQAKDMLNRALAFATRAHAGQVDKAGKPYIDHCIRVAARCITPEAKVVALLHDTLEDTPTTGNDIEREFGRQVRLWVNWLTRPRGCTYANYIRSIAIYPLPTEVKIADLRDNMNLSRLPCITTRDLERQGRYLDALSLLESAPKS